MKTKLIILTAFLTNAALSTPSVLANTSVYQHTPVNLLMSYRFDEGTEVMLSPEQIKDILPWAVNSKTKLEDALNSIRTLNNVQALAELRYIIAEVVLASAPKNTELLMRYALNRSLKLAQILEQASKGQAERTPGVVSQQLRFLVYGIKTALSVYQSDLNYLNKAVSQIEYAKFGHKFFTGALSINDSVLNAKAQYQMMRTLMGYLSWDLYRDVNQVVFAPEIKKLNDKISSLPENPQATDREFIHQMRQMRRVIEGVTARIPAQLAQTLRVEQERTTQSVPLPHYAAKFVINHSTRVLSASFSPDGSKAITGSSDKTARITDIRTGNIIREIMHSDYVTSVAYSPDGSMVITGSWDNTAKITDIRTGKIIREISHSDPITSVAFSPDGSMVITGSEDNTARITDIRTGKIIREIRHSYSVRSVAFSPDGSKVITGSSDKTARITDIRTGSIIQEIRHSYSVTSVAFSPDGSMVITGSWDNTAKIADIRTGKIIREIRHSYSVTSVAFSPDGSMVIMGSGDNTARITDIRTGSIIQEIVHSKYVTSVAFSPDGSMVITGSDDGTAKITDLAK